LAQAILAQGGDTPRGTPRHTQSADASTMADVKRSCSTSLGSFEALVLTGPGEAEVRRQPQPPPCTRGEALIRVAAVGVCATDVELFEGTMGYYEAGLAKWPLIPGHKWAGEIIALGPGCPAHLSIGQKVVGEHATGCQSLLASEEPSAATSSKLGKLADSFSRSGCAACSARGGFLRCPGRAETGFFRRDGAFQTQMRFPASQLHVLPDSVPWELAALAEPLAVALKAVRVAGLDELGASASPEVGPRVVVVGDGTMGQLLVQVLRMRRSRIACVVGTSPSRLARAAELGAETVWNIKERGTAGLVASLEAAGELPAVVIEAAGHPSAVSLSLSLVSPGGRVLLLGISGNRFSEVRADDIVLKQLVVRGSLSSEPEDWSAAADVLSAGALQSVVTHTFRGLQSFREALQLVKAPPEGLLKVLLFLDRGEAAEEAAPPPKRARAL